MVAINPPFVLQNAGPTHTAAVDRLALGGLLAASSTGLNPRGGVAPAAGSELGVTQTGSPSMQIIVNSGIVYVPGTEVATQGVYVCVNDAQLNLTVSTAHGTLPRIDSVIARVYDSQYSGASDTWALEILTGTASGTPSAPALPANSIRLYNITVGAGVTSITNAALTDLRTWVTAVGGIIPVNNSAERDAIAGVPTSYPLAVYRMDTGILEVRHNGVWQYRSPTKPLLSNQNANPPFNVTGTFVDFLPASWAPITFTIPPSGMFTVTISAAIENNASPTASVWAAYRISGGLSASAGSFTGLSAAGTRLYGSRTVTHTGGTVGASCTVTPQWNIGAGGAGTSLVGFGQLSVRLEV